MTASDWIAQRREMEWAATEGPWRCVTERGTNNHALLDARGEEIATDYEGVWYAKGDAEFIADARTALPKTLDALEAVTRLHEPTETCYSPRHTNPDAQCPECRVTCAECGEDFPCPTVTTITEALGVDRV